MKQRRVYSFLGTACAANALLWAPSVIASGPVASADPCPDVEVVFARGTTEAPGVGWIGDNFVDALRPRIGTRSLGIYPVNYPASPDFPTAIEGITDAGTHVESMAANCPKTKMVLGGYSQGAAVIGFVTSNKVPDGAHAVEIPSPMPPEVANHVAAVALFGKPSEQFMSAIDQPPVTIGPLYVPKTIDSCVPTDVICSGTGDFGGHHLYIEDGLVDQAADFVAGRIAAPPPPAPPAPPGPTH